MVEKIPLLVLTIAACAAAPFTQSEAVVSLAAIPIPSRIANGLVSYVAYVGQLFYPAGLVVFYPHPGNSLPAWKIIGAFLVLTGVSAAALLGLRRFPSFFVGWFWYLGTLVPMIGLVQIGTHAQSDRYTYVTQIGLYLVLAWGAGQIAASWPHRRWVFGLASAAVVAGLMVCAWRQTSYWRDSETLWSHALACTSRNWPAHDNLGVTLSLRGQVDQAITHYRKALEIQPDNAEVHNNLAETLRRQGA